MAAPLNPLTFCRTNGVMKSPMLKTTIQKSAKDQNTFATHIYLSELRFLLNGASGTLAVPSSLAVCAPRDDVLTKRLTETQKPR